MASLSVWHWLIVGIIVILVFCSHKFGFDGRDAEAAVRNAKRAINDGNWSKIAVALLVVLLLIVAAQTLTAR